MDFRVDYNTKGAQFLPFREFDVEISNIVDINKANVSRFVRKMTTNRTIVNFHNCTDYNNVVCRNPDEDHLTKNQTIASPVSQCVCLPSGDYRVTVFCIT